MHSRRQPPASCRCVSSPRLAWSRSVGARWSTSSSFASRPNLSVSGPRPRRRPRLSARTRTSATSSSCCRLASTAQQSWRGSRLLATPWARASAPSYPIRGQWRQRRGRWGPWPWASMAQGLRRQWRVSMSMRDWASHPLFETLRAAAPCCTRGRPSALCSHDPAATPWRALF